MKLNDGNEYFEFDRIFLKNILLYAHTIKNSKTLESIVVKACKLGIIDKSNEYGWTPLMLGLLYCNQYGAQFLSLLLNHDVSLEPINSFYYTWQIDDTRVQDQLINLCAKNGIINSVDNDNCAPLVLSIIHSNYQVAKLLIKYGADVTITSNPKTNPFYYFNNIQDEELSSMLMF